MVINRPTTPGVSSHHQSAIKTEQAIHTSDDTQAPPGVLSAEETEDVDSDNDDADSDEDKTSSKGNSNSDSDDEDNDPHDGIGANTPLPDTQRRYQQHRADRRKWETRFSNDRYMYTKPKTGPRYEPGTDENVLFQMADVIKDTFLAHKSSKNIKKQSATNREEIILGIALAQYILKAGLRVLGERGENVVVKELSKIHDMYTFTPVDAANMTCEERRAAVSSLMFLKENFNGGVKRRSCANGAK